MSFEESSSPLKSRTMQDQQQLMAYLKADEPTNVMKQRLLEEFDGWSAIRSKVDEKNKENVCGMKSSKVVDEQGRMSSFLQDRSMNDQQQLNSQISDTKSFYRVNGLLDNEEIHEEQMNYNHSNSSTNNNSNSLDSQPYKQPQESLGEVEEDDIDNSKEEEDVSEEIKDGIEMEINIQDSCSATRRMTAVDGCTTPVYKSRDEQLRDWLDQKKQNSNSGFKHALDLNRRNEFVSTAQMASTILASRDGKMSAPAKSVAMLLTPTKPISPKFMTAQRSQIHALKNKQAQDAMDSLENSEKKPGSVRRIDPKNFFLETERRANSRSQTPMKDEQDVPEVHVFKARPVPEYRSFSVTKTERQPMEFKEFTLSTEERGRQKEIQLKHKTENEKKHDEISRCFTALQLPNYMEFTQKEEQLVNSNSNNESSIAVQQQQQLMRSRSNCTTPVRDIASAASASQMNSSQKKTHEFKAKKMPDFSKIKYMPTPSPKKVTIPIGLRLSSATRAEERRLFDEKIALHAEESRNLAEEIARETEREAALAAKHSPIFKAQPIKKYKAVEIKRSEIPLTIPEMPKLLTDTRVHKERLFN